MSEPRCECAVVWPDADGHHPECPVGRRIAELQAICDDQARLLFWGEALMRSMSGWPSTHPNEFTDWKEDWRIAKDKYKALAGQGGESHD